MELFAEEVVRGGPAFALSLVLSAVEPTLRAAAELGAWQLISPVNALGRVVVVAGLHEVQDEVCKRVGCMAVCAFCPCCLTSPLAALSNYLGDALHGRTAQSPHQKLPFIPILLLVAAPCSSALSDLCMASHGRA